MISTMADFDIVNFPFLDSDILLLTGLAFLNLVYSQLISQLIARVSSHVADCNNKILTAKAVSIIIYEKLFQNFIADTMTWFLNSSSD